MLKIPSKLSVGISITLSVIFFLACIVGAFIMPSLTDLLINTYDNIGNRADISNSGRVFVLALAYAVLAVVSLADSLLFFLLCRVHKGQVFTADSVALIRGVSWCCFLLCLWFTVVGIWFQLSLVVAVAAVFLGLCLRVVKNVIEQAIVIKEENDFTV